MVFACIIIKYSCKMKGEIYMIQMTKVNMLIPLEYSFANLSNEEENALVDINFVPEDGDDDDKNSIGWFKKYFKIKPIEKSRQMKNSPLRVDANYKIDRFEFDSNKRGQIGILNKVDNIYQICDGSIKFNITIGKIRILFTRSKIAFLNIEIMARDLDEDNTRKLISLLSRINRGQPLISFERKKSINEIEEVEISLKDIISNIINIQSYIPLLLYRDRIVTYFQIYMAGTCVNEDKLCFFDSIQAMSDRASSRTINKENMYIGKEEHVSRFVGDRCSCIYGDIGRCNGDSKSIKFLTDFTGGLAKSAAENYTPTYAYLISLHLLLENGIDDQNTEYIINAPSYISEEENIQKYYMLCLWNAGWRIREKIDEYIKKIEVRKMLESTEREQNDLKKIMYEIKKRDYQETEMYHNIITMRKEIKGISDNVEGVVEDTKQISKGVEKIAGDVNFLVDFVKNDLSQYLKKEKEKFVKLQDHKNDSCLRKFIIKTSSHIDKRIMMSGDKIINEKRMGLELIFKDKWEYLLPTAQTSLISAGVLLERCSDLNDIDFDFSGICICLTSALEAELKRIFFDGFIRFMIKKYGDPKKKDSDEIYKNWPEVLLNIPEYKYSKEKGDKLDIRENFTMGTLPYLFGKTKNLSKNQIIHSKQLEQAKLTRERMTEYLKTIVKEEYVKNAFGTFCTMIISDTDINNDEECFVGKCEYIRENYRNKAAHIALISEEEAKSCYRSIITKPDTYDYNDEVMGVILELFNKINYNEMPFQGQIVKVSNLEITKNLGLRGNICGTECGVSLSKNCLSKHGISASEYVGKLVKVRLLQWDKQSERYNAEWIDKDNVL